MNPQQNQAQQSSQQPESPVPPERAAQVPSHDNIPQKLHPMVVLQPGERVVAVLKRHPIGIISMYISAFVAIVIIGVLAFVLFPSIAEQYNIPNWRPMAYTGLGALTMLMILVLGVATVIYWENQWVITTDSITQITQNSLFNRQVAQLSMDNLEDVTVDQNGILPHVLNYGNLKVETAGERSKFVFHYCPNPNEYARKILEVHESFLEERRNIQNR